MSTHLSPAAGLRAKIRTNRIEANEGVRLPLLKSVAAFVKEIAPKIEVAKAKARKAGVAV